MQLGMVVEGTVEDVKGTCVVAIKFTFFPRRARESSLHVSPTSTFDCESLKG